MSLTNTSIIEHRLAEAVKQLPASRAAFSEEVLEHGIFQALRWHVDALVKAEIEAEVAKKVEERVKTGKTLSEALEAVRREFEATLLNGSTLGRIRTESDGSSMIEAGAARETRRTISVLLSCGLLSLCNIEAVREEEVSK